MSQFYDQIYWQVLDVETSWSMTSHLECDSCAFNLIKSEEHVSLNLNTLDQIQELSIEKLQSLCEVLYFNLIQNIS